MVELARAELDRVDLPALCMRCGRPAQRYRPRLLLAPAGAGCAVQSSLLSAFQQLQERWYCPRCWKQRYPRVLRHALWADMASGALGLLLVLAGPELATGLGWFLVNVWLVSVMLLLLTVPHELGHALAAILEGGRVFRISIGAGRTIVEFRVASLAVEFKAIPVGGCTWTAPHSPQRYRTRQFVAVLGGPLVHVMFLAGFAACVPLGQWWSANFIREFAPLTAFAAADLLALVITLEPVAYSTETGPTATDGLTLLQLMRMSEADVRKAHADYFVLEGFECHRAGNYERAIAWYEQGTASRPSQRWPAPLFWPGTARPRECRPRAPRIPGDPGRRVSRLDLARRDAKQHCRDRHPAAWDAVMPRAGSAPSRRGGSLLCTGAARPSLGNLHARHARLCLHRAGPDRGRKIAGRTGAART
jgi:hypothetical protein